MVLTSEPQRTITIIGWSDFSQPTHGSGPWGDIKGRTNQAFFSKVGYTVPGTPLAGYPLRTLAPVSRDESVVRAIQRPGVRP